jgi:hypothetical protein
MAKPSADSLIGRMLASRELGACAFLTGDVVRAGPGC